MMRGWTGDWRREQSITKPAIRLWSPLIGYCVNTSRFVMTIWMQIVGSVSLVAIGCMDSCWGQKDSVTLFTSA